MKPRSHDLKLPILLTALLLSTVPIFAENWPTWRGSDLNGVSAGTAPVEFGREKNFRWRLDLPGPAGATPVIWDKHIFLTAAVKSDLFLIAASTEGKILWKRQIASGNKRVRNDEGNYASPSPTTDGKHVWTFMANGALACFDFDGNEKWKLDVGSRYGKFDIQFGLSSTPVLHEGRLFLQLIHGKWNAEPSRAYIVALDAATGKEVWKTLRETDGVQENKHSYASPVVYQHEGRAFLVTHGADYAITYDCASGEEIWRCGDLNEKRNYNNYLRFVASPSANEGIVVIPTAKNRKVVAVRMGAKGDVTNSKRDVAWILPRSTPDVPSPLIRDGLVYLCRENGVLIVLDAKSGEKLYEERTVSDRHRASPVWAGGKVYLTARKGKITVVEAGRNFKILATNDLGEETAASPAISNGVLYVRTFDALWAFGNLGK